MKTHPTDLVSLIPGLLFLLIGGLALFDAIDLRVLSVDWVWPALLIGAGVAVLLTTVRPDRDG
jgi:hypothetical protein